MTSIGGLTGPDNPCLTCEGTGLFNGDPHVECLGTGKRGGIDINIFLMEFRSDCMDKLDDIKEKVDEIHTIVDAL